MAVGLLLAWLLRAINPSTHCENMDDRFSMVLLLYITSSRARGEKGPPVTPFHLCLR